MNMSHQFSLNEEQKEILKEIRDASYQTLSGNDKNGIPFLKHIFELHYKIFGETCSTCPNKIGGYIEKLKKFNPDIKMEIVKSNFELNDGVIIPIPGTSDVYSKHNLTDEVALKILVKNPNRRSLFRVIPDDLDELIEEYVSKIEVKGTEDKVSNDETLVLIGNDKLTIEEVVSLLELINIKTKATTVTGVSKKISELSPELLKEFNALVSDFISKRQPSNTVVKTIEYLRSEYENALAVFQDSEVKGTEEEKEAAFKVLEEAQTVLEEAENKINKGE